MRVEAVDGAAARAGLREGDVILSLDNTEITDAKQFEPLAPSSTSPRPSACWCGAATGVNYLVIRRALNGAP